MKPGSRRIHIKNYFKNNKNSQTILKHFLTKNALVLYSHVEFPEEMTYVLFCAKKNKIGSIRF